MNAGRLQASRNGKMRDARSCVFAGDEVPVPVHSTQYTVHSTLSCARAGMREEAEASGLRSPTREVQVLGSSWNLSGNHEPLLQLQRCH